MQKDILSDICSACFVQSLTDEDQWVDSMTQNSASLQESHVPFWFQKSKNFETGR